MIMPRPLCPVPPSGDEQLLAETRTSVRSLPFLTHTHCVAGERGHPVRPSGGHRPLRLWVACLPTLITVTTATKYQPQGEILFVLLCFKVCWKTPFSQLNSMDSCFQRSVIFDHQVAVKLVTQYRMPHFVPSWWQHWYFTFWFIFLFFHPRGSDHHHRLTRGSLALQLGTRVAHRPSASKTSHVVSTWRGFCVVLLFFHRCVYWLNGCPLVEGQLTDTLFTFFKFH